MFGWAFLGTGNIAEQVADELLLEEGLHLVSCWNRTGERAEKFAKKYGCRAYATPEEALKAEGVHAAYIAVTADKHLDYIRLCLNAGIPVLCEKPFTVNSKEAEEAFALAKEKGVYLVEAMWTWFNAPALTVKSWLEQLGKIKKVTAKYCVPISSNPRLVDPVRLGGALVDIGVYPIRYSSVRPTPSSAKAPLKGALTTRSISPSATTASRPNSPSTWTNGWAKSSVSRAKRGASACPSSTAPRKPSSRAKGSSTSRTNRKNTV